MNTADQVSVEELLSVLPVWSKVTTLESAIGLPDQTLLHCGPPVKNASQLVTPILNSSAVACVFEGWAKSLDEADEMILSGDVNFEAAQNHNVVTPMAAVVSSSMTVTEFSNLNNPKQRTWAPLNGGGTGADPVPRYGRKTQAAVDFLHFLNKKVGKAIELVPSADSIPWLPIIDEALTRGDDGHLRHVEAHQILMRIINERLGKSFLGSDVGKFLNKWPFFHLNFWMAASKLILSSASGVLGSSIITSFGGNGKEFGLQVAGLPGRWFTCQATPPLGNIRPSHTIEGCVGAFGDSAITEGVGLGAMAQSYSPDMQKLHKGFSPKDILILPKKILMVELPQFKKSRARVGMSARAVTDLQLTPVLELGIADKYGKDGGLGVGIYRPFIKPFEEACQALG